MFDLFFPDLERHFDKKYLKTYGDFKHKYIIDNFKSRDYFEKMKVHSLKPKKFKSEHLMFEEFKQTLMNTIDNPERCFKTYRENKVSIIHLLTCLGLEEKISWEDRIETSFKNYQEYTEKNKLYSCSKHCDHNFILELNV
jgi:hypothetical protein